MKSENLGKKLKEIRKNSKLTQKQVAEFLDVDQSLVSKIENGERSIDISDLNNLANLYCCPVSSLTSDDSVSLPSISFRTRNLKSDDLRDLMMINRIALDQFFLDELEERNKND